MAEKFSDRLWNGLAEAVADIREKVVEEPYFGRVVTERPKEQEQCGWPQAIDAQPGNTKDVAEQNHEREADRDIDR